MTCSKCGRDIPESGSFCCFCGASIQGEKGKKKSVKRVFVIIAIILAVAFGAWGGVSVYENYKEEKQKGILAAQQENNYKALAKMMLCAGENNFDAIEKILDLLPMDYRDVTRIRKEYTEIKKNAIIIKEAKRTDKESEELRKAYAAIIEFNENNHNWNLSEYIKEVYSSKFSFLIFGKDWIEKDKNYGLYWYGSGSDETLSTSLPNDKKKNKDYYFYVDIQDDAVVFGYENKKDAEDKFDAYKVVDVFYENGNWKIKVYCHSTMESFILE